MTRSAGRRRVPGHLTRSAGDHHRGAMAPTAAAPSKGLLIKAAVLFVAVLVVGGLALRGVDVNAWARQAAAATGRMGPWVFFGAAAVTPAFGMPLAPFALLAGPAFSVRLGMGGVLAAYGVALAVNLALTYWLARFAVRPWANRLVAHYGYQIPQFRPEEQLEIVFLVRVTVGPPFFLQSYLLGLGNVAFVTYLWVSWLIAMIYAAGCVVFGDAMIHGRAGMAFGGVSLLIAAATVTHLVRRHLKPRGRGPGV